MNYYNEFDPKAAAWLRELIKQGIIPPGDVDERSITEIKPHELAKYTQCHFFAGIGGWAFALALARWPADRPCGSGSCPCQPFSDAGAGLGTADPRHLWPAFFALIVACRALGQRWTDVIFGEQVASKTALAWLDGVFADLEGAGYTCGATDLCAASVGAPQIRQRLHWVAYATGWRCDTRGLGETSGSAEGEGARAFGTGVCSIDGRLADSDKSGCGEQRSEGLSVNANASQRHDVDGCGEPSGVALTDGGDASAERLQRSGQHGQRPEDAGVGGLDKPDGVGSAPGFSGSNAGQEGNAGVADDAMREPDQTRPDQTRPDTIWMVQSVSPRLEGHSGHEHDRNESRWVVAHSAGSAAEAGAINAWSRCGLIPCTDGKTRRVEPESLPLAHGVPGRVGLLRGYGNAIVPQEAAVFIEAFIEVMK